MAPVADPYASQLASFGARIPNARRGLIDLYKLRRRGVEEHYNYINKLYGSAANKAVSSYAGSDKAIRGFEDAAVAQAKGAGYDTGDFQTRQAIRGIIGGATNPIQSYLAAQPAAVRNFYRQYKGAEQYEDKTLKTGLLREQPAGLSELESGILEVQGGLREQSQAFQSQQDLLARQRRYMDQMLALQRKQAKYATTPYGVYNPPAYTPPSMALPKGGGGASRSSSGGGGLSPAESWIIKKESSGNVHADNPTSSAFGLGQLIRANRQRYGRQLGFNPNTTDYGQQLAMMRAYIGDRYGSAEAAMRFWQQNGWY
jgi:hypothetical protein